MNKKLVLSILLLTSLSFGLKARVKMDLEDPILQLVDGVPGAMDAYSFKKCFDTWSVINNVQYKKPYAIDSITTTLKDLVIKEQKYIKLGTLKTDPDYAQLLTTLVEIKKDFITETTNLLDQAKSTDQEEENNRKLVALWIKKQKRTNSLLASWGTEEETALLEKADSKTFFVFLNDLKYFLEDLMYSCKKSRTMFKEECLKKSDHASFDKFFTN
ncbi:MAG: hypothetical protein ACJAZS_000376 [Alteromonas naphthalenivorans]|jgi:hypothetical protein